MAVLAEYRDVGPPGYAVTAGIRAFEAGQSIMERKQLMRLREQQAQQQQAEFVAKLPLLQAQTQLEQTNAAAAVANATRQTQLQAQAASASVGYQNEYNDILKLDDWDAKAAALEGFQAKTAWMADLKNSGYSGFVQSVADSRANAEGMALMNRKLEEQRNQLGMKQEFQAKLFEEKSKFAEQLATERNQTMKDMAAGKAELFALKLDSTGSAAYKKERGKAQAAIVGDVESRVPQHYATLEQTARARAMIDQDAEQGRGRGAVLAVMQGINSFLPGTFDTSKEEVLKQSYAEMALAAAAKMKGQGSITEAERSLLAESVAKFGNSPAAAKYIMDFMDAVAKREIARAEFYAKIEAGDKEVTSKDTTDFYRQNPVTKFLNSEIPQGAATTAIDPSKPLTIKSIRRVE